MENLGMFIIGCVVCALYLTGYLYMIKYANDSHDRDLKNDLEKARKNFSKSKKNKLYTLWRRWDSNPRPLDCQSSAF